MDAHRNIRPQLQAAKAFNVAAASAEPPPMPEAIGKRLVNVSSAPTGTL